MTSHLPTYSALQCLLLFQTLAAHRPDSNGLLPVAQSLKNSALFTKHNRETDDQVVSPETLQSLYDRTVSEMSKTSLREGGHPKNGVTLRKGTKSLEKDALGSQAARLIPILYDDYRKRVIEEIRAEEQKYGQLSQEIKSLELVGGKGKESTEQQTKRQTPPAEPPASNQAGHHIVRQDVMKDGEESAKIDITEKPGPPGRSNPRRANASIDSIINHDEPSDDKHGRPSTSGSGAAPTPTFPHEFPYAHSNQHNAHLAYPRMSPTHRDSLGAHDMHQAPSPRPGTALSHATAHSPTSPVILPPPPGMNPPPFPPTSPYSPHADSALSSSFRTHAQPYGAHQPYSAHDPYATTRYPEPYASQYSPRDGRRPSSGNQPQPIQGYPPYQPSSATYPQGPPFQQAQRGGVMLPPFQLSPHAPAPSQPTQHTRLPSAHTAQATQPVPLHSRSHSGQDVISTPAQPKHSAPHPTPLSAPHTAYLRGGVSMSPGSTTIWRNAPSMQYRERSPPRSISPLSDREPTPVPAKPATGGRGRKGKGAKAADAKLTHTRAQPSSDRSPSVSSHFSETIGTIRGGRAARRPKPEPPGTPTTTSTNNHDPDAATSTPSKRTPAKRKRADSSAEDLGIATTPATLQPPDTVLAYRNFAKMAQPVLNVIASHKHASLFAEPVRERQAEGYRDMIKRPQDLKSIRAAIAAGARAVTAAVESQQASPGAGSGGNAVVLPVSETLVPPRGIVNAAQLELEVVRMFANAVMFNPGDDEIVLDSREMFESVEGALQQWRGVERVEEGEDEEDGGGKRRRL